MLNRLFLVLTILAMFIHADEIRPGYLEVKEIAKNSFSLMLKVPAKGNKRLSLDAKLPESCKSTLPHTTYFTKKAYIDRWNVTCKEGIFDKKISIVGLESTNTDLLLRLEFQNGTSRSQMLTPDKIFYKIPKEDSSLQVIKTYTYLGITHILEGFDHLMFVFALLLIVKSMKRLLLTITAFTLAHSITMAGATLGFLYVPQAPVEAIIALSILFMAMEIMHTKQGKIGIASTYPWVISFIFGLLHGFGFAGALAEIGLPQQAITLALLFFNVGVEVGQLMFVSVVILVGFLLQKLQKPKIMQKLETLTVYAIGGISSFWVIERISAF